MLGRMTQRVGCGLVKFRQTMNVKRFTLRR